MIELAELVRLGQLYPPGSLNNPSYAFAGGTAVQCWLFDSMYDRQHHDIDLFAFSTNFIKLPLEVNLGLPLIIGGVEPNGIVAYSPNASIQVQIVQKVYYDSEIAPTMADIRLITIKQTPLLVLSPEFIAVSKLSYPNIHRSSDFQDVLALNLFGVLQNKEYLSKQLMQTSLGRLIDASDILNLKSIDDLQSVADSIHRQLIRRFLHWDCVDVDALAPLQFFVLLDIGDEIFNVHPETLWFINGILEKTALSGRGREIAKLGLHFLTMSIPDQGRAILREADFQAMIRQGLALIPKHSTHWLSRTKTTLVTLQHLVYIGQMANLRLERIWNSDALARIMQRILFDDPSRFLVMMLIKSIYNDLKADRNLVLDCDKLLNYLATPASDFLITYKD